MHAGERTANGMMLDLSTAVVLDFPLRGEWRALNTPAERVPSHGTDYFGQRYAFDFVQMDAGGRSFYRRETRDLVRHLTVGLPASDFLCWDQPIHAAASGRVVAVGDGWPDRARAQVLWEVIRATLFASGPRSGGDYRPLTGNFVIVEGSDGCALYAHLRQGTVRVRDGERVEAGDLIGAVGNSGNSTMPHLHFHLMDGPEPLTANGLLCTFRGYERWQADRWEEVDACLPGPLERIRSCQNQ